MFRASSSSKSIGQSRNYQVVPGLRAFMSPTRYTLPAVRVVVSSNAEQYMVVDVSGASSGSMIREQILTKLRIPENIRSYFSIYQSEIGAFAIGGALTNTVLFQLCYEHGDPSGSLKFFVSTLPDRAPAQYVPSYNAGLVPSIHSRRS